jgi:NADH:ubiquinone reductase (H+-translocating)
LDGPTAPRDALAEARRQPRVVIVGAGFGGLRAARRLRNQDVDVVLIDRQNFHTFLPLLYEVASAGLDAGDIAQPVRAILPRASNVRFRMANVERIDADRRSVITSAGEVEYDYLVMAAGSTTNYFGMRSAQEHALPLRDLFHAARVRNQILHSFERAVIVRDRDERDRLMTIVIVGGGPTGVELAGALAELKRHVLPRDYPDLDVSRARVILLEATDRLLSAMPPRLQRRALEQLRSLGVEVWLNTTVSDVSERGVTLADGRMLPSSNVVWVAGVRGETVGESLGAGLGAGGRVRVLPTLQVPGHPELYVLGDMAHVEGSGDRGHPWLATVALQQGELAAENVLRQVAGSRQKKFRYRDRGTMATIGRRMAVAHVFGLQFSGFVAWLLWLGVHLVQLIGLRNRALVLVNWVWNYFRYDRANRLVTDESILMARAGLPDGVPDRREAPRSGSPRW